MKPKIAAIELFIQNNLDKRISLKKVSEFCDVNYYYLSAAFKKKTGVSFSKYIRSLKIERAKILLEDSPKEIKEIAYELGYKSLTHFYRDFKSVAGKSPNRYRIDSGRLVSQNLLEKIQNLDNKSKY